MENKGWLLACVIIGFACFFIGINWHYFFPGEKLDNEDIYNLMMEEWEKSMKNLGMWNKSVSDVPVHVNNHKTRVMFEIDNFIGRVICDGTRKDFFAD